MAIIYILFSGVTGKFYIGSSHKDDSTYRLSAHNAGRVKSTKSGRPWVCVHKEDFPDYTSARRRELFLKTGIGRNWMRNNVNIK